MNELTSASSRSGARIPDTTTVQWDTTYEWRSILLLSLGFALVGFDRYLIFPMFPVIMVDLKLDYADLGKITGALAFTYGISAFVVGRLADKVGRKATMITALAAFSLLVGFSGLAAGALSLVLIRALMGATEGAYASPSLVACMEASKPSRHGMSLGFYQMASPLVGLAIAPILVTQLIHVIDWRYIFVLAAPPGLIIAVLLWRTIREPLEREIPVTSEATGARHLRDLMKYRNVGLAAVGMLAWLNAVIMLTAFLPSYLVDLLKLPTATMGFVMSSVGFGAVFGSIGISALSDSFGRKPCALISVVAATAAVIALSRTGAHAGLLFLYLLVASAFLSGLISLTVGPITIEALPVHLRATATGTVIAVGELFGGGVAPIVGGYVATHFGISAIFYQSMAGLVVGLVVCLLLQETAPAKTGKA